MLFRSNLNAYYSLDLKRARLAALPATVRFESLDIADAPALAALVRREAPQVVVHLAAQGGVRYSIENPFAYAHSNLLGHLSVLEACRHAEGLSHLVYASSSSVYGDDSEVPFRETAVVNQPVSLYAATKASDELMSSAYAHLYGLKQVGLRFFTVYGRWGRPDMAYWLFAERMLRDEPINVFNEGRMRRDMTHVSDVVAGLAAVVDQAPAFRDGERPHRVYNVGNSHPETLIDMIETLEAAVGRPARKTFLPMQPGDVTETYADISRFQADYGYSPRTPISEGLPDFVAWLRGYLAL